MARYVEYVLWLDKDGKPVAIQSLDNELLPEEIEALQKTAREAIDHSPMYLGPGWEVRVI